MSNEKHALVVLSGGQDSTTCLFWALKHFDKVSAITFDYGQSHAIELEAAQKVRELAEKSAGYPISHEVVTLPGILHSASPLTNNGEDLAKYESFDLMEKEVGDKVEKTFVPMRNTFFLTVAANRAVELGARYLVTGVCQGDNANYPDCTAAFIGSIERAFNQSLGVNFDFVPFDYSDVPLLLISTPLMYLSKAETAQLALEMDNGCWEALAYSHTSYDGKYPPTDRNHSNLLRERGFLEAGLLDPLVVRAWYEDLMPLPETANYDPIYGMLAERFGGADVDLDEIHEQFDLEDFLRPEM